MDEEVRPIIKTEKKTGGVRVDVFELPVDHLGEAFAVAQELGIKLTMGDVDPSSYEGYRVDGKIYRPVRGQIVYKAELPETVKTRNDFLDKFNARCKVK